MPITNDLTLYENYADDWWKTTGGKFKSLQSISHFRLATLQEWFGDVAGKTIIDLGCGGGLLAVPLIELGADVIGVDISEKSLQAARTQAKGKGQFIAADIRKVPLPDNIADAIVIADVLDHIPDYSRVIAEAARLLKPQGLLYVNIINRTWQSYIAALLLGEGLGFVPKGTHDYRLFIKPQELLTATENSGFSAVHWMGEIPAVWKSIKNWRVYFKSSKSLAVAYGGLFRKERS